MPPLTVTAAPPTKAEIYRTAAGAAWLGLGINLTLGVVKLVAGIVGDSLALISDAANSLGDAFTSVVIIFAIWFAQRPADEEHPYGHTRAEALAGSHVAVLILMSALFIGWEAFRHLWDDHGAPPVWTLYVAAGNAVLKEGLFWYKRKIARRTGSLAIMANAWDHRSDALCSLAVLVGLATVRWGGPRWAFADELATMIVVLLVAWSATRLFLQSLKELLDLQADPGLVRDVRRVAEQVPGVLVIEKLFIRKTGLEYLIDMHVQVDGGLSVSHGHDIGHRVKDRILLSFPLIRDVLIHLEPVHPHPEYSTFKLTP